MPKRRAIAVLVIAEVAVLTVWFSTAAVTAEMAREAGLSAGDLGGLSTAVQLGFAAGALGYALLGLADRFDPRAVFCLSALVAAVANLALLGLEIGGWGAVAARALTGAMLAGVYPVGMKIAVGWGREDRALLVGLLIGALTLGSASPHLLAWIGGQAGLDWRAVVVASSALAALGGLFVLASGLGPHHVRAARLDPGAIRLAWTDRRLRLAILAYLGHMWELYAFWAWGGVAGALSFAAAEAADPAGAKLTAFLAIALGGLACVPAGWLADRLGRAEVALGCLVLSGVAGLATALAFGGPPWLMVALLIVWGGAVIPDSALYSTMVADQAPADRAGSLMTLQTALGFLLTALTVQGLPLLATVIGWPWALAGLALGPAAGAMALRGYIRLRHVPTGIDTKAGDDG